MKLVYGVGFNDSDKPVYPVINGKQVICPFYLTWKSMLMRSYSANFKQKKPSYAKCTVDPAWHYFSEFKSWMVLQNWRGNQLDKDLLYPGNKTYSANTCIFVSPLVNGFLNERKARLGNYLTGVYFHKQKKKLAAACCNPFTKKQEYLGLFDDENEAHQAWKNRKHEIACQLADQQSDPRISKALRIRFLVNSGDAL